MTFKSDRLRWYIQYWKQKQEDGNMTNLNQLNLDPRPPGKAFRIVYIDTMTIMTNQKKQQLTLPLLTKKTKEKLDITNPGLIS